jgi:dihydroxy-acid dehydratase
VSPEAAEGGAIALVQDGDRIRIDVANRSLALLVSDDELAQRRAVVIARGSGAWKPVRDRAVSTALQAYALMATSAARGAVRDIGQLQRKG